MIKGKRKRAHSVHLRVGRSKETARIKMSRYPTAHDGGEMLHAIRWHQGIRSFAKDEILMLQKARDKRARRQVRNLRVMEVING